MNDHTDITEMNVSLRVPARDKEIIDQAAQLLGTDRTAFMMASALKAAKTILHDQINLVVSDEDFAQILNWMETPPTPQEAEGMSRLLNAKAQWQRAESDI